MNEWMVGQVYGWDGGMDGWINGQMGRSRRSVVWGMNGIDGPVGR